MLPGTSRSLTLALSRSTLFFDGLGLDARARTFVHDLTRGCHP
jgi:hypothetical protein